MWVCSRTLACYSYHPDTCMWPYNFQEQSKPLSAFLNVFSPVPCFLWHLIILSLLCLLLFFLFLVLLPPPTPHPSSPVFPQCISWDSGIYACTLRGFWILRKFGFTSFLPTASFRHQYFIRPLIECSVQRCNGLLGSILCIHLFCGSLVMWFSVTDLWPDSLCCRQFVRRHQMTPHNMKSVKRLYKQSARSVALRSHHQHLKCYAHHILEFMFVYFQKLWLY